MIIKKNLFLICLIVLLGALTGNNWVALVSFILRTKSYQCQNPKYDVRVISYHPLLNHFENFNADG